MNEANELVGIQYDQETGDISMLLVSLEDVLDGKGRSFEFKFLGKVSWEDDEKKMSEIRSLNINDNGELEVFIGINGKFKLLVIK